MSLPFEELDVQIAVFWMILDMENH